MNFNKLKKLFPKKSVLNKNKWLLLAIVVVVCVGLYWYSRKNKENFQKYDDGYKNLTTTNNVELNRDLYTENTRNVNVKDLLNPNAVNLYDYIRRARDTYVEGLTEGCTLNQNWLDGAEAGTEHNNKGMINKQVFHDFFFGEKSEDEAIEAWVLGDEDMFNTNQDNSNTKSKCQEYNTRFKEIIQPGTGDLVSYKEALKELNENNTVKDVFSETDFATNTMNETITVFVAGGCTASNEFLTKIWTKDLTDYLLETYPSISLNVEKCEELNEGTDGRIKDNMCNLSGLFSTPTKTSPLGYPLIQHSVLLETKNSEPGKNVLIQQNFDPSQRYDLTDTDVVTYEELDPSTEKSKTIYSAKKIKDWTTRILK